MRVCACSISLRFHAVEDATLLLGDVGEGHVHAFLFEDAGHFLEDGGGVGAAFEFGEALREFVEARDAGGVGGEGGFAELLALGGFGCVGFREVAVAFALGAEEDLFADAGGGDLRPLDDGLLALGDFLLPGDDPAGALVGLLFIHHCVPRMMPARRMTAAARRRTVRCQRWKPLRSSSSLSPMRST